MRLRFVTWPIWRSATTIASSTAPSPTNSCRISKSRSNIGILRRHSDSRIAQFTFMKPLEVRQLGVMPYADALALQRQLVEARRAEAVPDLLLLVEHPPVLTLGVRGDG